MCGSERASLTESIHTMAHTRRTVEQLVSQAWSEFTSQVASVAPIYVQLCPLCYQYTEVSIGKTVGHK
jgi:hypothetical protein